VAGENCALDRCRARAAASSARVPKTFVYGATLVVEQFSGTSVQNRSMKVLPAVSTCRPLGPHGFLNRSGYSVQCGRKPRLDNPQHPMV
jgi:hypothetical protein